MNEECVFCHGEIENEDFVQINDGRLLHVVCHENVIKFIKCAHCGEGFYQDDEIIKDGAGFFHEECFEHAPSPRGRARKLEEFITTKHDPNQIIEEALSLGLLRCRLGHPLDLERDVLKHGKSLKYQCDSCGYIGSLSLEILRNEIERHKTKSLEFARQLEEAAQQDKERRSWYKKRQLRFVRSYTKTLRKNLPNRSACAMMVCDPIKSMTEDAVDRLCAKGFLVESDLTHILYHAAQIRVAAFSNGCVSGKARNNLAAAILYLAINGLKSSKTIAQSVLEEEFFCSHFYWHVKMIESRLNGIASSRMGEAIDETKT